jgi:hypothetical protein
VIGVVTGARVNQPPHPAPTPQARCPSTLLHPVRQPPCVSSSGTAGGATTAGIWWWVVQLGHRQPEQRRLRRSTEDAMAALD